MQQALARALYSTLLRLLTPVYLARLLWRGRHEAAYRERLGQRLGLHAGEAPLGTVLWLHAVSLGETRAAEPLVHALRAQLPGMRLVLSCSTATGAEAGRSLLRDGDRQVWLPYDTPGAVRRFLRHFKPAVGVLMETEVWPNLLFGAGRAGVPMVLANARLSPKSQRQGERFAALLSPAVAGFDRVFAQTEADAERLRSLGAKGVEVCGNLKFDINPPPALLAQGALWRRQSTRPVVLMASSREGEEAPLLAAWAAQPAPRPLLLLVPRHPQRFDEVARLVESSGLVMARRSQWGEMPTAAAFETDVWLGDSMGEMPLYGAAADVALLGGSFAPLGGQNLIELAACGCPVVMGPHTFNFAEAAELALAARAALRVADLSEGVQRALAVSRDAQRAAWSQRALLFATRHRGATERMAQRIVALLSAQSAG